MLRIVWDMPDTYTIVHLNDIAAPESIAYLIKYDSIHGTWGPSVEYADGFITIEDGSRSVKIACAQAQDPTQARSLNCRTCTLCRLLGARMIEPSAVGTQCHFWGPHPASAECNSCVSLAS